MTSAIAPPPAGPTAGHPVLRLVGSLSPAMDRWAQVPVWSMTAGEQREALVALARQQSRLKQLELELLLQGDRDDSGAGAGAADAAAWLAHATRTSTSRRHRDLHLAAKLDERFGATRKAL